MTIKQQKAIENVMENRGNVSRAMIEAGYDPTTAKNPKNLTESKAWKELMDKHFSEERLAQKIDEGLEATRVISAVSGTSANGGTTDFIDVPDFAVRHKYVETGLKIRRKFDDDDTEVPNLVVFNIYDARTIGADKSTTQATSSTTDVV